MSSRDAVIMTEESIARVQANFNEVAHQPRILSGRFYEEMFRTAPQLRPLFPRELTALQGHFDAALALVIRNLADMDALLPSLRDLGAQHIGWGAQPQYYLVAREALIHAVRSLSPNWNEVLERDWREAISAIIVPMLDGAALATAMAAAKIADESRTK